MLTVVTGAGGFVGQALTRRMLETGYPAAVRLTDLAPPLLPGFSAIRSDLSRRNELARAIDGADCVIHLASLPGAAAEADPTRSRSINLDVTLDMIEALAGRRLVLASSIAVFGCPDPTKIDDATSPRPTTVYGTHKLMCELALADAVRRGALSGIALRLPAIVARPPDAAGFGSAFLSDVFHAARAGSRLRLPVGPEATSWMLSARACADMLMHAAQIDQPAQAVLTLPALRVRMADLVTALADAGADVSGIHFDPDPAVERLFGAYPELETAAARSSGFAADENVRALVRTVLADA